MPQQGWPKNPQPHHYVSGAAWRARGYTSCASRGWPITRRRDLAHCGRRHSNLTVLMPASSGSMAVSRIEDPHELHITEPY
jgi:hypothetical protein